MRGSFYGAFYFATEVLSDCDAFLPAPPPRVLRTREKRAQSARLRKKRASFAGGAGENASQSDIAAVVKKHPPKERNARADVEVFIFAQASDGARPRP